MAKTSAAAAGEEQGKRVEEHIAVTFKIRIRD
jgi:hypothetical protein